MSIRSIPPVLVPRVVADYEAGATGRELASKYGCSDRGIWTALREGGAKRRTTAETRLLRRRWGPDVEDEAIQMYRDGASVKQLSRHWGVRDQVISEMLARRNEPLHPGGRAHPRFRSLTQCREVAALYQSGMDLRTLAQRFGCTTPVITKALRLVGVEARSGRPVFWTKDRLQWLVGEYADGRSQRDIAEGLGVSQSAISTQLRRLGVMPSSSRPTGPASARWRGGRSVTKAGYVWVLTTEEDLAYCTPTSVGYVLEHRLVMGRALGRRLRPEETVHHINGQHGDNRLENLQLRQGKHGKGVVMTCNACGSHDISATEIADLDPPPAS
jgi:hypothetical protein